MTWQQIEHVLADYFRSLGIELAADGGELFPLALAMDDDYEPVEFWLSDLAKHLEQELGLQRGTNK